MTVRYLSKIGEKIEVESVTSSRSLSAPNTQGYFPACQPTGLAPHWWFSPAGAYNPRYFTSGSRRRRRTRYRKNFLLGRNGGDEKMHSLRFNFVGSAALPTTDGIRRQNHPEQPRRAGVKGWWKTALYLRIATVLVYAGDSFTVLPLFEDGRHLGQWKIGSTKRILSSKLPVTCAPYPKLHWRNQRSIKFSFLFLSLLTSSPGLMRRGPGYYYASATSI